MAENHDRTINERQRKFREKMRNAGYKQKIIWVRNDEIESEITFDRKTFFCEFRSLLKEVPKEKKLKLFKDILFLTKNTK